MVDSTFHVLLIGADGYLPNLLSNGGSYPALGGCVNDVLRVQAMLKQRLAGHRLAIKTLLAPAGHTASSVADESSWPTASNIRNALAEMTERAQPGDQVYIHYSGHGGRVVTAWKGLKGADGIDEALVPIDIGRADTPDGPTFTRPERYIRDIELALYLDGLASKVDAANRGITVTLVFDSCHSGGTTRGLGELAKRSATGGRPSPADPSGTLDQHEIGASPGFTAAQMTSMGAAFGRLRASSSRSAAPAETTWLPPVRGYVLLAGCRDVEAALECSFDGRPRAGVLTDSFLEALSALGTEQSWKTVYDRVLARVGSLVPFQTPQLLGDIDRHVFGVDLKPIAHTLLVTAVDRERRRVTLNGGLALTVTTGTEVGIYRPGETDFSLADRRLAVATIVEANDLDSSATLDEAADPAKIEVGAPAVIQALPLRSKVELFHRTDLPADIGSRQPAALAAVAAAITAEGQGFLETCAAGVTPRYQVALTPLGHYEICDLHGKPFPYLEPAIAIDQPRAASSVVAQLRRLGRYHTVLEMTEPTSGLRDQVQIELLAAPADWKDGQPPPSVGGTPLSRSGDAYSIANETWLWVRLTNRHPNLPVNAALLNLNRKWEVELLVPHPDELRGKRYETVSDRPLTFAFRMYTPLPEAIDTFKLFLAIGDVDFPALATTGARARSTTRSGGGENALGRLIDAINATEHRTRDAMPARSTSAPWTVRELRIRTSR